MPAPPPHEGPCRRSGDGAEHDDDIPGLGRYRGLCGICRPIVAAAQKQKRSASPGGTTAAARKHLVGERDMDGMRDEIIARSSQKGKLRAACLDLAAKADRLEDALEERHQARIHAQATLGEFKEGLQLVGRVAQSLVNMRAEPSGE